MIDPDGIHRAVLNIVTNAIDAAEGVDGGPGRRSRPRGTPTGDSPGSRSPTTASGIDEADIASIFQVFASTKGSRGTGLGLPVSQKIVREHGGKIVVTSKPGQGSQFVIELPLRRPEASKGSSGTGELPMMPG